jgi:hypothetical protein
MMRDPIGDHLLTPQNVALLVIDYQPSQIAAVRAAGLRKLVLCALWTEMCMACKCFFSERIQQNFSSGL